MGWSKRPHPSRAAHIGERCAIDGEFAHRGAACIRDQHIAESIHGDASGLFECADAIVLHQHALRVDRRPEGQQGKEQSRRVGRVHGKVEMLAE